MGRFVQATDRLMDYLSRVGAREVPAQQRCRAETAEMGQIAMMQIAPEQGAFLALLVRLTGATRCLEVGTFTGYSALSVALAMPRGEPSEAASDFALIADTSLEPEPVLRCAEAAIRKRGGSPVRSSLGAFTSVRDQSKPLGEVAIRADGLFVLSGGKYFRDVIDSANGARREDEASRLRARVHAAVRRKLGASWRPQMSCISKVEAIL